MKKEKKRERERERERKKGDLISVENSGYVASPSVKIGSLLVCGY